MSLDEMAKEIAKHLSWKAFAFVHTEPTVLIKCECGVEVEYVGEVVTLSQHDMQGMHIANEILKEVEGNVL